MERMQTNPRDLVGKTVWVRCGAHTRRTAVVMRLNPKARSRVLHVEFIDKELKNRRRDVRVDEVEIYTNA